MFSMRRSVFFEFKRRTWKHEKLLWLLITAIVLIVSILWQFVGMLGQSLAHVISVVTVLLLYFDMGWKTTFVFYFGNSVVLSLLSEMVEVLLSEILRCLLNDTVKNYSLLIASTLLAGIWLLGRYYKKKYRGSLKKIGNAYWILFITILFFDAMLVVVLGDFVINKLEVTRKWTATIAYCGIVLGIMIQLILLINALVTRNIHKENEALAKQFLENQKEHYQYLEKRELETKKFRHDIKNHLLLLENFINNKEYDDVEKYLKSLNEKVVTFNNHISVNNGIADAILNKFYSNAAEQEIELKVKGHFPMNCNISAYDLCTVLSNLLSNAIHAESQCGGDCISVEIRYTQNEVFLVVENDYRHDLTIEDGILQTTKTDTLNHGLGLSIVKDCVEKGGGYITVSTENYRFKVMVSMNNKKEETT